MNVSATKFKANLGKYLAIAQHEDVFITKYNKPIIKLTKVSDETVSIIESLIGVIQDNGMTLEDYRNERLTERYGL